MMHLKSTILLVIILFSVNQANAQKKKKRKSKSKIEEAIPKKDKIKEFTKKCESYEGLFTMYQDTTTGETYMKIKKDQLEKEYIFFSYVENGNTDAFLFKGAYNNSRIFSISKYFDKIQFKLENNRYFFDSNNNISKAADANINTPIIASLKILAEKDNEYIISGDKLFGEETFMQLKPTYPPSWKGFRLGRKNNSKSRVEKIKNYPENTDVRLLLVYDNSGISSFGSPSVTDGRSVGITYHQTLIEMPDNNFKPRRDDSRIGYFTTQVTDLTSSNMYPYRDMIHRWHLEKKNPEAALSEPVEPIVWWMENTTPKELRPIIKEGVESWNKSFEKIGFKNAVVVKQQPDTASWDAGDIRYNVLRWTSSPNPPFGGYGPSFVNPRTGQILGADVMLEYVYIIGRLKLQEVFELAGMSNLFPNSFKHIDHSSHCQIGQIMQEEVAFANNFFYLNDDLTDIDKNTFIYQSLRRLVLHEVGHTLGFNHNMKGSSVFTIEQLKDKEFVAQNGMCNSVMEYPSMNFALNKEEQTYYYDFNPGYYDDWIVEYGYSVGLDDEEKESERLEKILSKSSRPELAFGNDADDMRAPGKGIDPAVNIFDLSSDPVKYSIERIRLIDEKLMPKIYTKIKDNKYSPEEARLAFLILTGQKASQLNIITRQIAGVYVNRTKDNSKDNYTPVSKEKQKEAMDALNKYAFAPDAFKFDPELMQNILARRRGFNFFVVTEDPKLNERVLNTHRLLLLHLLHPNVFKRMVNTQWYGNEYKIDEYLNDLTENIFDADKSGNVNSFRQNLQSEYVQSLIKLYYHPRLNHNIKSNVLYQLNQINKLYTKQLGDNTTKAHRSYIKQIIAQALEKN